MAKDKDVLLQELLAPVVESCGLFLEKVRVVGAGKHTSCRVIVDLPSGSGGVDSTKLATVTRAISKVLDEADPITSAYTLEVSTPGADRQLTEPRHFDRAVGRKVALTMHDGSLRTCRIRQLDGDQIVIDDDENIALSEIMKAKVVVELHPEGNE